MRKSYPFIKGGSFYSLKRLLTSLPGIDKIITYVIQNEKVKVGTWQEKKQLQRMIS